MMIRNNEWPHWHLVEQIGLVTVHFGRLEIYMLGILNFLEPSDDIWTKFGVPEKLCADLRRAIEESSFSIELKSMLTQYTNRFGEFRNLRNEIVHSAWLHGSDSDATKNYIRIYRSGRYDRKEWRIDELEILPYKMKKLLMDIEDGFNELYDELPNWKTADISPEGLENVAPIRVPT